MWVRVIVMPMVIIVAVDRELDKADFADVVVYS